MKFIGGYYMNNQKNANNQSKSQSSVTSSANAANANNATNAKQDEQSLTAKQQASKSEYGTLTAKLDANNDYK